MRTSIFIIAMFFAAGAYGQSNKADEPTNSQPQSESRPLGSPAAIARSFIRRTGVNRNIIYLMLESVLGQNKIKALQLKYGQEEVNRVVRMKIQPVIKNHIEEWEINLAATYLEFFSPEELDSLAKLRTSSPYFDAFRAKSAQVGPRMRERTGGLLREATAEAVTLVDDHFRSN